MNLNILLYLAALFALPPAYALYRIGQHKFHKYAIRGLVIQEAYYK